MGSVRQSPGQVDGHHAGACLVRRGGRWPTPADGNRGSIAKGSQAVRRFPNCSFGSEQVEVRLIRGFRAYDAHGQSELTVIVRGRQLCGYVLTVTDKSPKKFRFTLVGRLQNYSLDVVESLYRANLVYVRGSDDVGRMEERRELQRKAYVDLKTLAYLALLAKEQGCILGKQYEQISMQVAEVLRLLVAWAKSDRRRYGGGG